MNMAVVETERHGQVLVVRMNRPDRLNALNTEIRSELARIWTEFRHDKELEVAIFTGIGRGFMLVERTDLRVAVREAVFEVSEAKRWLLGGYNHGHVANLPYPIAMEMALGFRFTAQRFYEVGFLNRIVDAADLMPTAIGMAEHLLTLPPASRVNTVHMMRHMRPSASAEQQMLAAALHDHGDKNDLMESRAAFAEKRRPAFKGWKDPQDRYRLPTLDSV